MIKLAQANVLTVGLRGAGRALQELPIKVTVRRSGVEAARSLKTEKFDSVISKWDLDDMVEGEFLRKLRSFRPELPVIAIIRAGDMQQEIEARSLGVSAVLDEDSGEEILKNVLMNMLSLKPVSENVEVIEK